MTGTTICFANQKGGPGKTTTCHNLAVQMSILKRSILAVDIDGQGNLSTLFDVDISELEKNMSSVLVDRVKASDVVIPSNVTGIDLLPSNRTTYFAEKELTNRSAREFILNDSLDEIRINYDFVFIDTPPNLGLLTFSSIVASNYVIIVTTSSELSLNGISDILDTISEIQENKRINVNDTKILGVIHNDYKISNKRINRYAEYELQKAVDAGVIPRVFKTKIRSTTEIENAQINHKPISIFSNKHHVNEDYNKLAKEVLSCLN